MSSFSGHGGEAPVILVEDSWLQWGPTSDALRESLGVEATLSKSLAELFEALEPHRDDSHGQPPIVLLDAGLPGICRLETVRTVVAHDRRARLVQFTGNDSVVTHTSALLDGAWASAPKSIGQPELAEIVQWVANGRKRCNPSQAQWFADYLRLMKLHSEDKMESFWAFTQLPSIDRRYNEVLDRMVEIAEGEPFRPADHDHLSEAIDLIKPRWLTPRLRQLRVALDIRPTTSEAGVAMGLRGKPPNGTISKLRSRLAPGRFLGLDDGSRWLKPMLTAHHGGCSLPIEQHDLSDAYFGVRQ